MNHISLTSLCVVLSATLASAACVIDEEITTDEELLYSGTSIGDLSVRARDVDDRRVQYTGPIQQLAPEGKYQTIQPSATPEQNDEDNSNAPGFDLLNQEEKIVQRAYKCDTTKNFVRFLEYKHVSLHHKNGEIIKDAVAHCSKTCDYLGDLCSGFFYLDTNENGRFCGLVNGPISDGVWFWRDQIGRASCRERV